MPRQPRIVMLDIPARQYIVFLQGLRPDPRLPPTWPEWQNLSAEEERRLVAKGHMTARIEVDWDGFMSYARDRGPLTYSLLQIYANNLYRAAAPHGQKRPEPRRPSQLEQTEGDVGCAAGAELNSYHHGEYRTTRDGGVFYRFTAHWLSDETGYRWRATVATPDGQFAGVISGHTLRAEGISDKTVVVAQVEHAIELKRWQQ